mmetsp:Transcript_4203/g.13252  ORF Transcript_4203/g.13252 Transcript_4203/m.13252 type:complete len:201 (+) Transcript_4203:280-882(+)
MLIGARSCATCPSASLRTSGSSMRRARTSSRRRRCSSTPSQSTPAASGHSTRCSARRSQSYSRCRSILARRWRRGSTRRAARPTPMPTARSSESSTRIWTSSSSLESARCSSSWLNVQTLQTPPGRLLGIFPSSTGAPLLPPPALLDRALPRIVWLERRGAAARLLGHHPVALLAVRGCRAGGRRDFPSLQRAARRLPAD